MNALKDMLLGYTDAYRVTEMNLNQVGEVITDMEAKLRSTIDKKDFGSQGVQCPVGSPQETPRRVDWAWLKIFNRAYFSQGSQNR